MQVAFYVARLASDTLPSVLFTPAPALLSCCVATVQAEGGDFESDEDDEDFDGGMSSNGSADEYDDMDGDEEGGGKKKKKKSKSKRDRSAEDGEAPAPKKSKKPTKDPNAPKRPMSAFFLYMGALRESFKEDNPEMSNKDIVSSISANWNELSDEDKTPFNEEAADLKKEYLVKKAEYDSKHGASKAAKDPNAPKRPMSSYFLFSNEKRAEIKAENPDITFGEVGKKTSELWKALTADEKKPYDENYLAAKEKYKVDIAEYYEKNPDKKEELEAAKKRPKKSGGASKKQGKLNFGGGGNSKTEGKQSNLSAETVVDSEDSA